MNPGHYWMARVTPGWLGVVPTVTVIGTAHPEGAPVGMTQFTCSIPDIRPGAAPEYRTCAGRPPIFTVTGRRGLGSAPPAICPSTPGGSVCPAPVPKIITTEPLAAGAE